MTANDDAGAAIPAPRPAGGADQHDAEHRDHASSTAISVPGRSPNAIAIAAAAAPSHEMIGVTTEIGHRANAL